LNCQGSDRTLDLPTVHPSWKKFRYYCYYYYS